jgi:hypothetical protein
MEQKQQWISLLMSNPFAMSELCLTFGISRKQCLARDSRWDSMGLVRGSKKVSGQQSREKK